ncbi:hypothetical protein N7454_010144 [Penicillium verhagenii]|nr:hypothetical protein N7454_010144 [Penicillium verhagenii]
MPPLPSNFAIPAYIAPGNHSATWCRRCVNDILNGTICVPSMANPNKCARCATSGHQCIMVDSRLDKFADPAIAALLAGAPADVLSPWVTAFRGQRNILTAAITTGTQPADGPPRPGPPVPAQIAPAPLFSISGVQIRYTSIVSYAGWAALTGAILWWLSGAYNNGSLSTSIPSTTHVFR